MMQPYLSNPVFQKAVDFVVQTNRHLFLTGNAGTGKTTFLQYIRRNCFKKSAVVAPTGVAAINAGGVTIHSFFQLPLGLYIPSFPSAWGNIESNVYNRNQLLGKLRLSTAKRELLRELDLLIIDEISMVRADVLDAMDTVLRAVRRRSEPFGGVQMLYIGDLYQLPPVVRDEEKDLMRETYESPFFFDAHVIREAPPVQLELKQVYRQSDAGFIRILNNVRNNCCTPEDLQQLHDHYQPYFSPPEGEGYITLTTHNYKADAINRNQLARLPGKLYKYEAEIKGDFPEQADPAARILHLKEGAQIMFIKNDKGEFRRYFNGKIGMIQQVDDKEKKITVRFPDEAGLLELSLETWKHIRYQYDRENDRVEEEELGSFTQYPIRLAWAVTIHKSQGLTFQKAVVDAGAAFAPGQVYVALSRLTGLNGLVLRSPILPENILTDMRVLDFSAKEPREEALEEMLVAARQDFIHQSLLQAFDWRKLIDRILQQEAALSQGVFPGKPAEAVWFQDLKEILFRQAEIARKFSRELESLLQQAHEEGSTLLHERTQKAAQWFEREIAEKTILSIEEHIREVKTRSRAKKYVKALQELLPLFERKRQQLAGVMSVTDALQ